MRERGQFSSSQRIRERRKGNGKRKMRERGKFSENHRMEERTWEKKNKGEGPVLRELENGRKDMGKK